jgi:acetyltransferase-like isoleucine patch superfamily enzyme
MSGEQEFAIVEDARIGDGSTIYDQVNLYGCEIGDNTKIDAFTYIEEEVEIGDNCTIRPFTFIPTGVTIADDVFIGPQVTFTNDRYPRASGDWELEETAVECGASIGAGAVIGPGVKVGEGALVGAGSVVVHDVPANSTVAGNPAEQID